MKADLRPLRILSILPVILAAACGESTPVAPHTLFRDVSGSEATVAHDPAVITSARIEGDILHLTVEYGGGCTEHLFGLSRASGVWRESLPVQTDLRLTHAASDDSCLALLKRSIAFDLTGLKQAFFESYDVVDEAAIDIFLYDPAGKSPAHRLRYHF